MIGTATVLARPEVLNAIVDTITKAMTDVGISQTAVVRVGLGFRQRIEDGSPSPPAIALVDAIRKATEEGALTACGLCGFPIDSAPCGPDHAALKARFAENNGAGEAGGLLNVDR